MDFTYRSTTGPYTTVRRQQRQRLLRLRRLQDGDYDHHTTTGRRLRPSHDYRTATTTIRTTGRRLRPSRLQGGDYDHHDYRVATTTTTGRRPPRVRRHNQDVHHVMSTIMFHQIHTLKLHQNTLQTRGRPATLSNRLQIKRNNILNNMHII